MVPSIVLVNHTTNEMLCHIMHHYKVILLLTILLWDVPVEGKPGADKGITNVSTHVT